LLVLLSAAAMLTRAYLRPPLSPPEMRVEITTPPTSDPVSIAMSPDGRKLVFVANQDGLRPVDSVSSRELDKTDGAACPFWSPAGQSIGFFADGWLKRVDIDTGVVRAMTAALSCGGSWNRDDTILYSRSPSGPVHRISANSFGTPPDAVTRCGWVSPTTAYRSSSRTAVISSSMSRVVPTFVACTWAMSTDRNSAACLTPTPPQCTRRRDACCLHDKGRSYRVAFHRTLNGEASGCSMQSAAS